MKSFLHGFYFSRLTDDATTPRDRDCQHCFYREQAKPGRYPRQQHHREVAKPDLHLNSVTPESLPYHQALCALIFTSSVLGWDFLQKQTSSVFPLQILVETTMFAVSSYLDRTAKSLLWLPDSLSKSRAAFWGKLQESAH